MIDRERFFQNILKTATFNRKGVQIYIGQMPEKLKDHPVRRYVIDNDTLWRVVRIEGESVFCREATNQELADIREGQNEQA